LWPKNEQGAYLKGLTISGDLRQEEEPKKLSIFIQKPFLITKMAL
jgi:hypothetical protein